MVNIPMMDSYLESLAGYVCDDDKLVTYKWLSKELEVHVNVAKIILWRYWEKCKNDKLVATFMLIGDLKSGGMRVEVVRDADLCKAREKFDKIISEHVYSLQKTLTNIELLAGSGKGDSQYSAIKCDKSVELSDEELTTMRWGKACLPEAPTNEKKVAATEKKVVSNEKKVVSNEKKSVFAVATKKNIIPEKDDAKSVDQSTSEIETKSEEKSVKKISPPAKTKANEKKGAISKKPVQSTKAGYGNLFGKSANQVKTQRASSTSETDKNVAKQSNVSNEQKSSKLDSSIEKSETTKNKKISNIWGKEEKVNDKTSNFSSNDEKSKENEETSKQSKNNEKTKKKEKISNFWGKEEKVNDKTSNSSSNDEKSKENEETSKQTKNDEKTKKTEKSSNSQDNDEKSMENEEISKQSRNDEKTKKNDKSSNSSKKNSISSPSDKESTSKSDKKSKKIVKSTSDKKSVVKKNQKIARGKKRDRSRDLENETKKRKRIVVASDSSEDSAVASDEDDMFESPPRQETKIVEKSPSPPLIRDGDGNKRKIRKLVDKTFVDDEGFLITKKIHVYESCSEEEMEITETKKNIEPEVPKETKVNVKKKQLTLNNFFKKA